MSDDLTHPAGDDDVIGHDPGGRTLTEAGPNDIVGFGIGGSEAPVFYLLTGDRLVSAIGPKGKKQREVLELMTTSGDPVGTLVEHKKVSHVDVFPLDRITEMNWRSDGDGSLSLRYTNDAGKEKKTSIEAPADVVAEMKVKIAVLKGTSPDAADAEDLSKGGLIGIGILKLLGTLAATAFAVALAAGEIEDDGDNQRVGRRARRGRGLVAIAQLVGPIPLLILGGLVFLYFVWELIKRMKTPPQRHTLRFA